MRVLVHEACRDAAVLFTVMAYLFAPPKVAELGGLRQLLEGKRDPARTPRDRVLLAARTMFPEARRQL